MALLVVCDYVVCGAEREGSLVSRAANDLSVFTITNFAPNRAFSWLKAPTSAFTFETLLRHYAKQAPKNGK